MKKKNNYFVYRPERTTLMISQPHLSVLDSIVVSIPACHAGDRGSIPRLGDNIFIGDCAL